MHFEITNFQIFLGKGLPPYNTQKSYTYIHHKTKKRPEIWHLNSLIVEFPYASAPLQPLNLN